MVTAREIKDEDTLRRWLEGRPKTDALLLAHRGALRVLLCWSPPVRTFVGVGTVAVSGGRFEKTHPMGQVRKLDTHLFRLCLTTGLLSRFEKIGTELLRSQRDWNQPSSTSAHFLQALQHSSNFEALRSTLVMADLWTFRDEAILEYGHDAHILETLGDPNEHTLWRNETPPSIRQKEADFLFAAAADPEPWDFWRRWWEGARDGRPLDWELQKRVALIPPEEWEKNDPAHIARLIRQIEEDFNRGTALSRATPVDFTFDVAVRIMRMVGLDDDTAHLRDPHVVRRFLDDCKELRDTFNDFTDYARELGGSPNRAGVLRRAAEKVCAELDRTRNETHLRARYLVKLGHELELFAKEEPARADLGTTLAGILDNGISLLRTVTRRHFGPAYTALAPLAQLTLDHVDQDAAIALLDDMLARLDALPESDLVALDADGRAVFADMVREVQETRAALAEASSDEFRDLLRARMAESIGGTGVAFGRFLERSAAAAGTFSKATDVAVKEYKKVRELPDILKFIQDWLASFGGPPA